MQNLDERLNSLKKLILTSKPRLKPKSEPESLARALEGEVVENSQGKYILVENVFSSNYKHGKFSLGSIFDRKVSCLKYLGKNLPEEFNLEEAVFLDTETTGLSGGAGTYPFLIGMGVFENRNFILRQFFLPDYSFEKALLSDIKTILAGRKFLVSFNGKGYDAPLIDGRFVINRIPFSLHTYNHLDLLFPSRRIWKKRLRECNLLNLELQILKVSRDLDVASFQIPQIYFDYLHKGETESLKAVFSHNLYDILSLVGLLGTLSQIFQSPSETDLLHPLDFYSLGKLHYSYREYDRAYKYFQEIIAFPPKGMADPPIFKAGEFEKEEKLKTYYYLGSILKRRGEWTKASEIWHSFLQQTQTSWILPYVELAKFYEHQVKDYSKALTYVDKALRNIELQAENYDIESLIYRKNRLERKLGIWKKI